MTTSRRDFVQLSLLAGGAVGLGLARQARAARPEVGKAERPMKILVLGGTGLIGPPLVEHAVARGHEVTLFNRGKTNTHLFPNLEKLRGDRNDDLSALEAEVEAGRLWDADGGFLRPWRLLVTRKALGASTSSLGLRRLIGTLKEVP